MEPNAARFRHELHGFRFFRDGCAPGTVEGSVVDGGIPTDLGGLQLFSVLLRRHATEAPDDGQCVLHLAGIFLEQLEGRELDAGLLFFLWPLALGAGLEQLEAARQIGVDDHGRSAIRVFARVVGSREHGDQFLVGKEFVPLLHDLVGADHHVEIVFLEKFVDHVLPKDVRGSAIVHVVAVHAGFRVGPHEIAQQALFWNVDGTLDGVDLIEALQFGRQSAVAAENLVRNDGRNGHAVENVAKSLPQVDGEAALALVVKAVHATHLGGFVVPPQQVDFARVFDLEGKEETQDLDGLLSPIAVVSQEHVIRVRGLAVVIDDSQEVEELTVQIAANLDGCLGPQEHWFAQEYLSDFAAQGMDLVFLHFCEGPRTLVLQAHEALDEIIELVRFVVRHRWCY
mmetsp:Transcript_2448/g.5667  ORF Transcript_2448/g.5667 Transcript_2448/m.5667 type:complete len:398 (-) Transcript_2448:41-1234(-)